MISIALCTYNGSPFLRQQLDSILTQTVLPSEIVACDDGSTDDSVTILRDFAQRAPFPVHVHLNDTRLGISGNFGKAISLCKAKHIALCDQDDVWKPEKMEKLATALDDNPDAGYVFSDAELVDRDLKTLKRRLWDEGPNTFTLQERKGFIKGDQFPLLLKKNVATGACMMFRSSLAPLLLPIPESWIHDYWIATVASALGHRGVIVHEPLIKYRQHETQQIGIMKGNIFSKLRSGLKRWSDLLERDMKRLEALRNHLPDPDTHQEVRDGLNRKTAFLETRLKLLSYNSFSRTLPAAKMLLKGLYNSYSPYGWRTFLMDIIASRKKVPG